MALGESSDGQLCPNNSCLMSVSEDAPGKIVRVMWKECWGHKKMGDSSKVDSEGLSLKDNVGSKGVSDGRC